MVQQHVSPSNPAPLSTALTPAQTNAVQEVLLRPKDPGHASVAIHRIPAEDGVIVKVTPPKEPAAGVVKKSHTPCDIVLVIDISGSMSADAPVPGEESESNGLSVLDLVKHASQTILETLNKDDRLGIVTFETTVSVLQKLTPMTEANKKVAAANIASMQPMNATNLWQGMLKGVELFDDLELTKGEKAHLGRVPAVMVLTDGLPNYMSPRQGFIPKMETLTNFTVPIHTFGFGYQLKSGLLKSIAEFTGGNYAFIPDAGIIGTVFVHAVANIQATFATKASLTFTYPSWLQLEQTTGIELGRQQPQEICSGIETVRQLTVRLGSIQYGQTRDVYLRYDAAGSGQQKTLAPATLNAALQYSAMGPAVYEFQDKCTLVDDDDYEMLDKDDTRAEDAAALSPGEITFQKSRAALLNFIAGIFPLDDEKEHCFTRPPFDKSVHASLDKLKADLDQAAKDGKSGTAAEALLADIQGQVTLALSSEQYYSKWGIHYLPSLHSAHASQQCNSFKDPGPLQYGADSPLFIACRDALDNAFDTLPPPPPSNVARPQQTRLRSGRQVTALGAAAPASASPWSPVSMASYRSRSGPCFASFCRVTLADGRRVRVNRLRRGMRVLTPKGPRAVVAILKTPVSGASMVSVGRLLITPWHPISSNGLQWDFPCRTSSARTQPAIRYTGAIYSVLLQPDKDAAAHALSIEGSWVVTLGHGLVEKEDAEVLDDVRVHKFFGDYRRVCRVLANMGVRKDGIVVNSGPNRVHMPQWNRGK